MRSSGGTNFGLPLSVVVFTNSRIACFAGPSFHEGSGSAAVVAAGWPAGDAAGVGLLLQPARISVKESNIVERNIQRGFISLSPVLAAPAAQLHFWDHFFGGACRWLCYCASRAITGGFQLPSKIAWSGQ